jgi:type IV secretory pathway VirB4 component
VTLVHKGLRSTFFRPWKEDKLADLLSLDRTIGENDDIVVDGDGGCTQIIELMGQDFGTLSPEDRAGKLYMRDNWIKRLGELDVEVKFISHKSEHRPAPLNKQNRPHLARVDELWESQFKKTYELRHFIVFKVKSIEKVKSLRAAVNESIDHLEDYRATVLGKVNEFDNALLTHLSDLANPLSPAQIANVKTNIGQHVCGSHFWQRRDGIMEFVQGTETVYGAALGFTHWDTALDDKMFTNILSQDIPMTVVHLLNPLSAQDSRSTITKQNMTVEYDDAVISQMEQAKLWTTKGTGEEYNLCHHHVSILTYAKDEETLEKQTRKISIPISSYGLRTITEGPNAMAAFLSLFPSGRFPFREQMIFSHNMAAMAAFEGKNQGIDRCVFGHGPIHRVKPVEGAGSVNLHLHEDEGAKAVGHTTLIGRTGGGKTTFLCFLLMGLLRFARVRILALDRRKGMRVFTAFAGGTYISLENRQGLNPLQQDLNDPRTRNQVRDWLRLLGGSIRNPETDALLGRIMRSLRNMPKEHRSLITLWDTHLKNTELGHNMSKFIHDPDFNWIFNAQSCLLQETLRTNRLVTIDTLDFLDNEEIAPAFLDYVLYAVEVINTSDNMPFVLACDETAGAAKNKDFLKRMLEFIYEWRKCGGLAILAFQTDETIRALGLETLIKEQMATMIFWRNRKFDKASAQRWGMEEPEYNFTIYETAKKAGKYALLYKQNDRSASLQMDLSLLGDDIHIFNSDIDAAKAYETLEADPNVEDPQQAYLDLKGKFHEIIQNAA